MRREGSQSRRVHRQRPPADQGSKYYDLKITKEKTVAPHFGKDAIAVIVLSRALAAEEHGNESEQKLVKREISVENQDYTLDGRKKQVNCGGNMRGKPTRGPQSSYSGFRR